MIDLKSESQRMKKKTFIHKAGLTRCGDQTSQVRILIPSFVLYYYYYWNVVSLEDKVPLHNSDQNVIIFFLFFHLFVFIIIFMFACNRLLLLATTPID